MKKKILFLGLVILMSGSAVLAVENTTMSNQFSGQSCGISDSRLCDALTNELLKDLMKQTVYTVGTKVLNKYANSNGIVIPTTAQYPSTYVPVATPAPVVYAPTPTPVPVNTAATNTIPAVTTSNTVPQEQMIIVN